MEIVGAIIVTLVLGYLALMFGAFAIFAGIGFDEVNPKACVIFTLLTIGVIVLWWFVVGHNLTFDVGWT